MRFATIRHDDVVKTVLFKDKLIDLPALSHRMFPHFSPLAFPVGVDFIEAWVSGNPFVHKIVENSLKSSEVPIIHPDQAIFLPPVPDSRQIIGVGLNFHSHCQEQKRAIPERPIFFSKLVSSLNSHKSAIVLWNLTNQVDYEGEIAIIIGKTCKAIKPDDALSYIFGYTIANDITARDIQFRDKQWTLSKSLDTFCPIGPYVLTKDEINDCGSIHIRTFVNHELRQDAYSLEMIFPIPEIIAYLSQAIELKPGDIILTGTPGGVGVFRNPPIFLKEGDVVEVEIEGIGCLENPVISENTYHNKHHNQGSN